MKKLIASSVLALSLLVGVNGIAQEFELDKSPMDQASFPSSYRISDKLIKVTYSRPQLKGRALTKLAPTGKVWRTGANEAVEVTLYQDMKLGPKVVTAGTYTMYTIPGEDKWTVILNSDVNVWGAYSYDESKDVARITVPVTMADESIEYFGMAFKEVDKGAHLMMAWDKVRLEVPFYSL